MNVLLSLIPCGLNTTPSIGYGVCTCRCVMRIDCRYSSCWIAAYFFAAIFHTVENSHTEKGDYFSCHVTLCFQAMCSIIRYVISSYTDMYHV